MAYFENRHWWFRGTRRIVVRLLARFAPRGGRLLDVGCGSGYTLSLVSADYRSVGLDVSPDAVLAAPDKGDSPVTRGDACALPFADGSFDVVTALDVLEHLDDDAGAMAEIRRVLKPDGVAVLSVPAHQWLFSPHDQALGHVRRYSKRQFTTLVAGAGLATLRTSYSNTTLALPIFAYRGVRKLLPQKTAAQSDLWLPPAPVNATLRGLLNLEAALIPRLPLPFGISLVAVAAKQG